MTFKIFKFGLNMFKQRVLYKADRRFNLGLSKPTMVSFQITYKCNFKCNQCHIWGTQSKELTTQQWNNVILKIYNWAGPFYVNISGGEPFLRKDLWDIVKFANGLGIVTDVTTNGSLINKGIVDRIKDSGLDKMTFSLDSITPEVHDSIRNFKGSFSYAVNAIKALQNLAPNINISVNTVITNKNLDELEDIAEFVAGNNINSVSFRPLMCSDVVKCFRNDTRLKSPLWPGHYKKVCKSIDRIIELKSLGYPIANSVKHLVYMKRYFKNPFIEHKSLECPRTLRYFAVVPDGGVHLCSERIIGNIVNDSPQKIWCSEEAFRIRKQKRDCHRSCGLRNPGDVGATVGDTLKTFYRSLKNKITYLPVFYT